MSEGSQQREVPANGVAMATPACLIRSRLVWLLSHSARFFSVVEAVISSVKISSAHQEVKNRRESFELFHEHENLELQLLHRWN